jgi:hypothetical protein
MQGLGAAQMRPHNCMCPYTRPSPHANASRAHGRYGYGMRGHGGWRSKKRLAREGETWIDVVRCKGSGFMTCSNATGLEGYAAVRIGDDVQ